MQTRKRDGWQLEEIHDPFMSNSPSLRSVANHRNPDHLPGEEISIISLPKKDISSEEVEKAADTLQKKWYRSSRQI